MSPNLQISVRPARPDECAALTDLCRRAKAHWGYPAEMMAAWHDELTVTPDRIARQIAMVAEAGGIGLAGIGLVDIAMEPPSLDLLFVDPALHGRRVGAQILDVLTAQLAARGVDRIMIDADPHAEGFYLRRGARRIGDVPSPNTPGRSLPRLELTITPSSVSEQR